jgi:hypothetical protein
MWSYAIYDTITGVRQGPIVPASFSFSRRINDGGDGSMSLVIPVEDLSRDELRSLLTKWARTVVAMWNGFPIYAGLITSSTRSGNTVTFNHKDIRALLAKRTTFGSNGYTGNQEINHNLPVINYPLALIPAFLIWASTEGPTANYGLPIYLPEGKITNALVHSFPADGTDSRTYFDYEFTFIDDALSEIQDAGLELDFQPRFSSSGALEYIMNSANVLPGPHFDFVMAAPDLVLQDVVEREDAEKQSNVLYSVGKGSEMDMRVTTSRSTPSIPAMERRENYKDIDDLGILKTHSDANLATFRTLTTQFDMSIHANALTGIQAMPLGSVLDLEYRNDPWQSDGHKVMRLIGFSGDMSIKVKLETQPGGA